MSVFSSSSTIHTPDLGDPPEVRIAKAITFIIEDFKTHHRKNPWELVRHQARLPPPFVPVFIERLRSEYQGLPTDFTDFSVLDIREEQARATAAELLAQIQLVTVTFRPPTHH